MKDVSHYSAIERLRDGRRVEIRPLRPEDQSDLIAATNRASDKSMYRRFFGPKRAFTPKEIDFFANPDLVEHFALIARAEECGFQVIVGGARYVITEPGKAELALLVIDQYQRQGVGSALLKHLIRIARDHGINLVIADVLKENIPMLSLLKAGGFATTGEQDAGVTHLQLRLS